MLNYPYISKNATFGQSDGNIISNYEEQCKTMQRGVKTLKTISQKTPLFRAPHSYNILLYIYTVILYLSKHFIYIIKIYDISKAALNLMLGISATPSRSQLWIISYSSLALFVALLLPNLQLYDCTIVKYVHTLHCTYNVLW